MRSPAEQLIEAATTKLDDHKRAEALVKKGREIAGNIGKAMAAIPSRKGILIPNYAEANGDTLDLVVEHRFEQSRASRVADANYLDIKGRMSRRDVQHPAPTFAMYRIGQVLPTTDSGYLKPHYEISVADPESKSGYTLLALVEQSVLDNEDRIQVSGSVRVGYDVFGVHDQLSNESFKTLENTGIYVNPNSPLMLDEVQQITGLIASQSSEAKPLRAA